ncbi:MAG: hypothetical protein WDN48_02275 [Pseudolabrys sp.]
MQGNAERRRSKYKERAERPDPEQHHRGRPGIDQEYRDSERDGLGQDRPRMLAKPRPRHAEEPYRQPRDQQQRKRQKERAVSIRRVGIDHPPHAQEQEPGQFVFITSIHRTPPDKFFLHQRCTARSFGGHDDKMGYLCEGNVARFIHQAIMRAKRRSKIL